MWLPSKDQLDSARSVLDLVVRIAIIGVLVLIFWRPDWAGAALKRTLVDAGFRLDEITFLFFKLKATDTLLAADSAIDKTAGELKIARAAVICLRQQRCTPAEQEQIERIVRGGRALEQTVQETRALIASTITDNEQLLQTAERQLAPPPPSVQNSGDWIAVIGADRTEPAAQDEVKRVRGQFPRTVILVRDGWYRTGVRFDSEADARRAVPDLMRLTGRQPYVRDVRQWCKPAEGQTRPLVQCG